MSVEPAASAAQWPDRSAELASCVGRPMGPPELGREVVSEALIRHWVEAMGDENPVYTSPAAAQAAGFDDVIAPPTMLQAWVMRGLRATLQLEESRRSTDAIGSPAAAVAPSVNDRMMAWLDEEGRTSVVATNCEQHYDRPLHVGERLVVSSVIEAISDHKRTALGEGRFVTTRMDFRALPDPGPDTDPVGAFESAEPVGTMRFRILKFRPGTGAQAAPTGEPATAGQPATESAAPRPVRPRPAITEDNAFFFEGLRQGKLLIQRCTSCGTLRHPPLPACGTCRSFEWEPVEASGRGELFSFVVVHYPQVPAFDYPLPIGLIALEEGTRLVADLHGVDSSDLYVGMPVVADLVELDPELTLPFFRPSDRASAGPGAGDRGAGTGGGSSIDRKGAA